MINPHNKQEITITMLNVELIQNNIIIDIIIVRKSTIKLVKIVEIIFVICIPSFNHVINSPDFIF